MLQRIVLGGYKSIRNVDLELRPINILIGANGSGKSNFISIFQFMNRLVNQGMQRYVAQAGGANQLLHYGRKVSDRLFVELWFRTDESLLNGYRCSLIPTDEDLLVFEEESAAFHNLSEYPDPYWSKESHTVHSETLLPQWVEEEDTVSRYVLQALKSWQVYHFHDTSPSARVKQTGDIYDNLFLRPDASNLAAYLYLLQEQFPKHYRNIVDTIRRVAPFFGDFVLRPSPLNPDTIRLEWQERGSDMLFGPHALSDGTLRFMCLATLFLQPPSRLPATIILDEPELGLHPAAIALLAEMIHSAATHTQVIVATQSVTLLNYFTVDDVLVLERFNGETVFQRLSPESLADWLQDYSLGDLWEKNLLGGRPV